MSAMSGNNLIIIMIMKWPVVQFDFMKFCVIYLSCKKGKIAGPCIKNVRLTQE